MSEKKVLKIESLDWLRGLMAISVMLYHLTSLSFLTLDSSTILGRLGIYAVSIFFIISGLSMAIVYNEQLSSFRTTISFYVRRVFRIWPLLWIVTFMEVIPPLLKDGKYSFKLLFINITTLFGFIKPNAYIATGAWSIGNEMVFYALTPMIFYFFNFRKWMGNAFLMITILLGFYFSTILLDSKMNLSHQWVLYVNPFNNLFFYVMGISIYYNLKNVEFNQRLNNIVLIFALTFFCFLPFQGDQISIVTGFGRLIFVFLSVIIVICFFKSSVKPTAVFSKALQKLGESAYGIYLIHPIVYLYSSYLIDSSNLNQNLVFCIFVAFSSIALSMLSFHFFESRFIKIGRKLTSAY